MKRIILVDDDRTNGSLTKMLLEMQGFQVAVSPTLTQAQEAAAEGVDAFIIDCHLSEGDSGLDLLEAVRHGQTAADPTTPIIMTSGDSRQEETANQKGATVFLLKPYPISALADQLSIVTAEVSHE
jgi:CheY-like chemotaxis protein